MSKIMQAFVGFLWLLCFVLDSVLARQLDGYLGEKYFLHPTSRKSREVKPMNGIT